MSGSSRSGWLPLVVLSVLVVSGVLTWLALNRWGPEAPPELPDGPDPRSGVAR